ncbi:MAG: hypothetical protein JWQ35_854 [Bacteriovoracaceae bacterium]|nr:hypothetical protein [Bacteriovoracaceae bacterium]
MLKTRRKALKTLLSEKVVSIGDYRNLRSGRSLRRVALVTTDQELIKVLSANLISQAEIIPFDSRFSFEQAIKQGDWDSALLDQRILKDDTLPLCEKLKRQNKLEDLYVIILATDSSKDAVRQGYEKGCDEWITRFDDLNHLARLLSQHIAG